MLIASKTKSSGKKIHALTWGVCFCLLPLFAWTAETSPQKLGFSEDNHSLGPDKGHNEWMPQLFSRESRLKNDEEEEIEEYRGVGLTIKIMGGWNYFSGGDIDNGTQGLFDRRAEVVSSLGYTSEYRKISSCRSGLGLAAEVVYDISPRMGIGIRVSASHPAHPSKLRFYEVEFFPYSLWSDVDLTIVSFMAGVHYVIPVHRRLWFFLNAGPELHLVSYQYALNFTTPTTHEEVNQRASTKGFGGKATAGLEVHLNPRVALVFEVHGRSAKISNFEGKEALYNMENNRVSTSEQNGFLYYSEAGKHPGLSIYSDEAAQGQKIKKAVFDFSGIGLNTGLSFRF